MAGLERLCHCLQSLLRVGVAQGVEHSLVQDLRIVMINVATATLQHPQYLYPGKKTTRFVPTLDTHLMFNQSGLPVVYQFFLVHVNPHGL